MQNLTRIVVLFLFFTSGISGLIFEVVWIRMFGLVLGNTTYAISITIGSFFAGLALGGYYFGRFVDRLTIGNEQKDDNALVVNSKNKSVTIRLYAYLELGIGASALFVGTGISYMQSLFIWTNQLLDSSSTIINPMRFIFSFSLLLIPTVLMGATLPVLSKFLIRKFNEIRSGVAMLYGINTFGATMGCFITGFYLIQTFGVNTTIYIGVVINFAIGIVVLILERLGFFGFVENEKQVAANYQPLPKNKTQKPDNRKEPTKRINIKKETRADDIPFQQSTVLVVFLLFGLSGFTSIAYEIIWTRMLSSLFLNSIYSFTTMLVTFLGGLAIGAIIVLRISRRQKDPLVLLGIIEFCIGTSAILLIFLFNKLPEISSSIPSLLAPESSLTWNMNVFIEFSLSFMVMIIPCILIGMTLPVASQVVTKNVKLLGQSVGNIYSINTVGGILGALIAGCLLIPTIGVKFSELSMAVLNICIGITFLLCSGKSRQTKKSNHLFIRRIIIPSFCVFTIAIGISCYFIDIRIWETEGKLLYYKEDAAATVSVTKEKDGNKKLIVNKKYTLGTSKAVPLQKRMGYIPLFLHNNPQDVLVIGMGTGITLSAVASYESTETVNCIEVISSVAEAAGLFFAEENNRIYQNKKTNIIIEDGRNHLLLNKRKYDVIISDLFVPYHAGAGSLYTKEHFEICQERINDTGLFCQWLPLYQMSTNELKIISKTFNSVFPFTTLWFCNFEKGLICGLVGTKHKLKVDMHSLKNIMTGPNMYNQLKKSMIGSVEELLSLFVTDEVGLKSFTEGHEVNSDNYPIIEFLAPKNIYAFRQNKKDRIQRAKDNSQKINNRKAARVHSRSGYQPDLLALTVKAEEKHIGISNLSTVSKLKNGTLPLIVYSEDTQGTEKLETPPLRQKEKKRKNIGYHLEATGYLIKGVLYYYNDMLSRAEDEYLTAWELAPNHLYLRKMFLDLSVRFYRIGNYDETIFINEKLANAGPEIIDPFLYFYLGLAYQAKGQTDKAIFAYHNAIDLNPPNKASIHYNLGILYKSQGLTEKAISEFEMAEQLRFTD